MALSCIVSGECDFLGVCFDRHFFVVAVVRDLIGKSLLRPGGLTPPKEDPTQSASTGMETGHNGSRRCALS